MKIGWIQSSTMRKGRCTVTFRKLASSEKCITTDSSATAAHSNFTVRCPTLASSVPGVTPVTASVASPPMPSGASCASKSTSTNYTSSAKCRATLENGGAHMPCATGRNFKQDAFAGARSSSLSQEKSTIRCPSW